MSWPTAHRAFAAHAAQLLTEPEPTRVLGIDETRRGKPRWEHCSETGRWNRVDPWDTGFVDLAGAQGLLGQREGRTGATVVAWLSERTPQFRAGIAYVAIDPAAAYASAIRTPGLLPNATIVVDHFHLVKLANDALTKVRRRVTWDLRDRRGRKVDPEWANRRRLLRARERLSEKSFAKMWNRIHAEDPSAQILSAWIAKEELRTLLSTVRIGGDPHLTRHRLHRFLAWCIDSQIPELLTLAATIDDWWPEINAFVQTGITNARTEGYNRRRQAGQARRLWVSKPGVFGPPNTISLHPQTAGRNPDFMLIARSKLKSLQGSTSISLATIAVLTTWKLCRDACSGRIRRYWSAPAGPRILELAGRRADIVGIHARMGEMIDRAAVADLTSVAIEAKIDLVRLRRRQPSAPLPSSNSAAITFA